MRRSSVTCIIITTLSTVNMLNFDFHLESTPELDTLEVSLTKATTDFLAEKAKFDSLSAKARNLQKSDREAARKMATDVVKLCGEKCKELQLAVLGLEKRKREMVQQDVQMESIVQEGGEVPKELEGLKAPEVPELPKVPAGSPKGARDFEGAGGS